VPTKGFIYTLSDPRDGTVRYVGKTMKPLSERLAGHLSSPTNPAMRLWINTLGAQQMIPTITMVATVPEAQLGGEEDRLIRKHAKNGHRLFNAPYYHQHLDDLTTPVGIRPSRAPASVTPLARPVQKFCREQFEPIAKARAAGLMSRRRALVQVLLRSIAVVLYALWQFRLVRYPAYAGLFGWYFLDVGFDRLVQREALPVLPVAEVTGFWREYLVRPLSTIAVHITVMAFIWALGAYFDVRKSVPTPARRPSRDPVDVAAAAAAALEGALESRST